MVIAVELDGRDRILVEATRLFATKGFDGTSLQDVADASSVSKPAVLHHFGSKDELRRAALDAILAHWNKELPKLLLAASGSGDRFDAVLFELTRFFRDDPNRARMLMREALDRPHELRELLRGPVRPWLRAVSSYVESGRKAGRHHTSVDPEAYVVLVMELVVFAAATVDLAPAVLAGTDAAERQERELLRMARAALFTKVDGAKKSERRGKKAKSPDAKASRKDGNKHRKRAR